MHNIVSVVTSFDIWKQLHYKKYVHTTNESVPFEVTNASVHVGILSKSLLYDVHVGLHVLVGNYFLNVHFIYFLFRFYFFIDSNRKL